MSNKQHFEIIILLLHVNFMSQHSFTNLLNHVVTGPKDVL